LALPNPNEFKPDNKLDPKGKLNKLLLFDGFVGGGLVADDVDELVVVVELFA
jgi:hypothetical protein